MTSVEGVRTEVTARLALALDVDDAVAANRLAAELRPYFGVVKVGLELFAAAGPGIVTEMIDNGFQVFLDLKLADIPTTVERTARVLGALGASYLSLHAFTGDATLRAGVTGLADGALRAGLAAPRALAVTVLTSDAGAPAHVLGDRVRAAVAAGCAGVVCAARDVAEAKSIGPGLLAVVPGIRPGGTDHNDQARSATPEEALAAGADLLVVGRAVTAATDRRKAARQLVESLS
jgi:orotidine-5'-phosphate decarboxylase